VLCWTISRWLARASGIARRRSFAQIPHRARGLQARQPMWLRYAGRTDHHAAALTLLFGGKRGTKLEEKTASSTCAIFSRGSAVAPLLNAGCLQTLSHNPPETAIDPSGTRLRHAQ